MEHGFIVTNDVLALKARDVHPKDIQFRIARPPLVISPSMTLRTDTDSLPLSRFGKSEIEANAGRLIRLFQNRDGWSSFTIDELKTFYLVKGWRVEGNILFGLDKDWKDWAGKFKGDLVLPHTDGRLAVTDVFILWSAGRSEEVREVWAKR